MILLQKYRDSESYYFVASLVEGDFEGVYQIIKASARPVNDFWLFDETLDVVHFYSQGKEIAAEKEDKFETFLESLTPEQIELIKQNKDRF